MGIDIDLVQLEREVANDVDEEEAGGSCDVAETEYYDLLHVNPDANLSDIKKAYHREALQCHPDKNLGDAEAKSKFQKLADAYQVLSDPESRRKYNREGKAGIQEPSFKPDAALFFSLLFGSERFEPWIGELHLAMQTDQFAKHMEKDVPAVDEDLLNNTEVAQKNLKRRQDRREVMCACHLRDKLERFVYGRDIDGWEEQMRLEAINLVGGQFGPELLVTLGEIFQVRATIYLCDEFEGRYSFKKRMASMKHSKLTLRHQFDFYSNAASSLMRVKKVHDAAKNMSDGDDENQQRKVIEDVLDNAWPTFLRTAWSSVVMDVDATMKEAGRKLLKDKSVPWQIRARRAQALLHLSQIFLEEGMKHLIEGETPSGLMSSEAAKATLQEAFISSVKN